MDFRGAGRDETPRLGSDLAVWTQVYDPLQNWPLSTLMASLPVLVLLGLVIYFVETKAVADANRQLAASGCYQ